MKKPTFSVFYMWNEEIKYKFKINYYLIRKKKLIIIILFFSNIIFSKKKIIPNKNGIDNIYKETIYIKNFRLESNCFSTRQENSNINIQNCVISIISATGSGGAIFINSNLDLLVNDTTFYQCMTSAADGGAIHLLNAKKVFLLRVCALYCKSKNGYSHQFAYLDTSNSIILDYLSISKCYNQSVGYHTFMIYHGTQSKTNSNISKNINQQTSGLYFSSPISMISNYLTIYENYVSQLYCICLYGNSGVISRSNIINNNSPSFGVVFFFFYLNFNFKFFIFYKKYNKIFFFNYL